MFGHLVIFWEMTSVKNFSATSCIYGVSNLIYYKVTKIANIVWTTEALLCKYQIFLQLIHSSVMVSCMSSEKKCLSSSRMVMEKNGQWTHQLDQSILAAIDMPNMQTIPNDSMWVLPSSPKSTLLGKEDHMVQLFWTILDIQNLVVYRKHKNFHFIFVNWSRNFHYSQLSHRTAMKDIPIILS